MSAKRGSGRPPHEPSDVNRLKVETLVAFGTPYKEIAKELGIHIDTLRSHYQEELTHGKQKASSKVAGTLFRLAVGNPAAGIDPHPASAMFWLKCQAGWSERSRHEITGANGGPVSIEGRTVGIDYKKLSQATIEELVESSDECQRLLNASPED